MIIKMKLSAAERRAVVDLSDVIRQGRAAKKPPKKPAKKITKKIAAREFRPIEFVETTLHDPVRERWEEGDDKSGVRLYCTANPLTHGEENARWSLQIFAWVKTKRGGAGKHFATNTASMSREDLAWLRDQISAELRRTR
jgi:hypothetical protein